MEPEVAQRLARILACPACHARAPQLLDDSVVCQSCGARFARDGGVPLMVRSDSPVWRWYTKERGVQSRRRPGVARSLLRRLKDSRPAQRVWTRRSRRAIARMLTERNPDAPEHVAVLLGSGFEGVYRRALRPYRGLVRAGLPHEGSVDVGCDVVELPFGDDSLNLIFSSSILEHVYDPERAVAEMYRALRPGGYCYAEIPFARPFHMIPIDYQRYTISGIEMLFARHGFTFLDKGICSGPFTAFALTVTDLFENAIPRIRYVRTLGRTVLGTLLRYVVHPLKYLDLLCENTRWAEVAACNFYYLGEKPRPEKLPQSPNA